MAWGSLRSFVRMQWKKNSEKQAGQLPSKILTQNTGNLY